MKSLVAYFSATGTTEKVARNLAEAVGGTLYRITPETPYTADDLNWMDSSSRSSRENKDPSMEPAISGDVPHWKDYDTVYLGYPIWWGLAPAILRTFVKGHDFNGKTVIPFATSGGSGLGSSGRQLREMANGGTWKTGGRVSGSASADSLRGWARKQRE